MQVRRTAAALAVTVTVAIGLVVGVGVLGGSGGSTKSAAPAAGPADNQPARDAVFRAIAQTQQHLRDTPGDWTAWAQLGAAYVQQARLTADPTYYQKADGALARSLAIRPDGNALALTGQAALAAARHDFASALRLADDAIALDPDGADGYGVRTDALVELGRYDEAWSALQRMVDLRPGVASFTRASYSWELRGDTDAAEGILRRALADAAIPADAAYAQYYLGELAWNRGDVDAAAACYTAGLVQDPSYLPLLAGRAKVEAARGQDGQAVADYQSVVTQLPQPSFVVEYGEFLEAIGRPAEAKAQFDLSRTEDQLLRAQGVDVDLDLALYEADHEDPEVALRAASAEFAKRQSIFVADAYAWALHVAGRDAEALPYARSALRLGTRNALLRYHLGVIEAAAGRPAQAIGDLRAALALNPHFSAYHVPRAKALLADLEKAA
ncbi:tetratricopeptide repeat protein [Frankia sp. Cppng1_Ct_nod]|uniref:tetratricopeptide repeat protein n=1 Tax=Frankia sp. Cppng1_Ct_nod TaxID=2897162 RepID=UPI0020245DA6|nr:tetratricopeptide repeat protein [Frankia sp. Cppng1_Ct_nod]